MSSADQTMYLPTTDTAAAASAVETGDRSNDGRSSMAICNSNVDCRGCRQPIHDQYVLHVDPDSDWHVHCLRCVECRQLLNENCTCFLRDGLPYCKSDYTRLFSVKCSRCGMGFDRNQLVMRAPRERVYHVDCFRCIVCQTRLVSGSEFALRPTDSEIVCRSDYDTIMMCEVASVDDVMMTSSSTEGDDLLSPADDSAVILSTERIGMTLFGNNNNNVKHEIDAKNNTGGGHADSPSVNGNNSNSSSASSGKKNHQNAVAETTTSSRHASSGTRGSRSHEGHHRSNQSSLTSSSSSKTTRIRTVLNEKQLHTLRTCYAANPRPDALMKDQLVEMTGLSSRVIRVWFQNKRCKDKKRTILIKQLQQQHQDKVHGVPMIASSPVRMQDHQAASGPAASLMHAAAVPVQIHHQYIVPQAPPPQLCPPSVAATGGAQQQQQQHSGPIATWSTPCPSHVVMQQPTTVADLQLLSAAANPGIRCSPSLSISPTSLQLSEPASDDCCPTDRNSSAAFQQLLSTFGEGSVVVSNSGGSVRAAIGAPLDHRTAMVDAGCCFDDVIDDGDNAADFENSLMDDDDQTTVPTSPSVQSDGLGSRVDETGGHVLMTSDCAPGNSILSESCNSVQQTARGRMQQQQHAASLSFMARRHCGRGSHQQQQQQRMDHVMTAVSAADGGPVPATSLHRHHHHHHLGMVTPSTSAVTGGLMGSVSHLVCTDTRC